LRLSKLEKEKKKKKRKVFRGEEAVRNLRRERKQGRAKKKRGWGKVEGKDSCWGGGYRRGKSGRLSPSKAESRMGRGEVTFDPKQKASHDLGKFK